SFKQHASVCNISTSSPVPVVNDARIGSITDPGLNGAILQIISHGFIGAALFFLAGTSYDRIRLVYLDEMGGMAISIPKIFTMFTILSMASLALPGMSGIGSITDPGLNGAILQIISHGFIGAALFFLAGTSYDRIRLVYLDEMGGMAISIPKIFTMFTILSMASLALPGMSGIGSITDPGLNGAILQIISHGFIGAALFFLAGTSYDRIRLVYLDEMGGMAISIPKIFTMFTILSMASLALPGMSGIGSITDPGLNGAILQIISHGFIGAALFFLAGTSYDRIRLVYLDEMGGMAISIPKIFTMFTILSMASLALPGMSGIGSITDPGLNGAILQIISHGFIGAALFFLAGTSYDRIRLVYLDEMGGMAISIPKIFTMFTILSMASLALPGMSGIITVLLGATLALAQKDIKRGLAYSTMSQLGYMMLALGSESIIHSMEAIVGYSPDKSQNIILKGGLTKHVKLK
uniref:NADH:quinone oxidoreductase/Mrp antiporter transmembrane domain-containing protein n=1 Tax=Brassica oleracea var. oleracea TaxID=109376 RepID=A0A0D3CLB1_BRAOL